MKRTSYMSLILLLWLYLPAAAQQPNAQSQAVDETDAPSPSQQAQATEQLPSAQPPAVPGFGVSLMFSEIDNRNLNQVIVALRRGNEPTKTAQPGAEGPSEEDILAEILRQAQQEEQAEVQLPDFYLSSIVYRNANDWSIWVRPSNVTPPSAELDPNSPNFDPTIDLDNPPEPPEVPRRITLTSAAPSNELTSLTVDSITEDSVVFAWKPPNSFAAFGRYKNKDEELEAVEGIKNRLVKGEGVTFDADNAIFYAKLSPNQTWSLDLMQVLEGRYRTPDRAAARFAENNPGGPGAASNTNFGGARQSTERRISNELIGNIRKLQQFFPQRNQ